MAPAASGRRLTMAEYIEREELMKFPIRRNHYDKEHGNEYFICGIETVLEYAENLPAADVAPVVHGRWEKHTVAGEDFFGNPVLKIWACNCSVCGMDGREETPYCPNCGSKMDEVSE